MDQLSAGQVGYMVAGIKDIYGAPVGDTIIESKDESTLPLPGFKKVLPKVFASLFTVNSDEYEKFRDALAKLTLNDSSLANEESLRVSFAKASLNFSYSSELTVNRDAKTFGRTFLNPGSGNVDSSFDSIMVSPTGAP